MGKLEKVNVKAIHYRRGRESIALRSDIFESIVNALNDKYMLQWSWT